MKVSIATSAAVAAIILFITGCSVNTKLIERERVDQEISGNQGYLIGTPPPVSEDRKITRKYYEVQVELPAAIEQENRVSKTAQTCPSSDSSCVPEYGESAQGMDEMGAAGTGTLKEAQAKEEYSSYKVQKGDTLQKISQKFFGTTKKWKEIFSENEEILKSPDKIRPGQTIRIPKSGNIEIKESEYIK
ncbi:MAG: LysM peptidoglycan-binding domain-containing protein [Candidatus Omnitrophota bacterium]